MELISGGKRRPACYRGAIRTWLVLMGVILVAPACDWPWPLDRPVTCGDDKLTGADVCDGKDLGGKACTDLTSPDGARFLGGTLGCKSDCSGHDTSGCQLYRFGEVFTAGDIGVDEAKDMVVDRAGNITITGCFENRITFGTFTFKTRGQMDIFVARFDGRGKPLWAVTAGGENNDCGAGVALDKDGDAWVAGWFMNKSSFGSITEKARGNMDVFMTKLDSDGRFLWARSGGSADTDKALWVQPDGAGNALITGYFKQRASFGSITAKSRGARDAFVAKIDSKGRFLWIGVFGGNGDDMGHDLAVVSAGTIHLVGSFNNTITAGGKQATSRSKTDAFYATLKAAR